MESYIGFFTLFAGVGYLAIFVLPLYSSRKNSLDESFDSWASINEAKKDL